MSHFMKLKRFVKLTCSCAIWYLTHTYLQDGKLTDTVTIDEVFSSTKKAAQANFRASKNRNTHLKNLTGFLSFH